MLKVPKATAGLYFPAATPWAVSSPVIERIGVLSFMMPMLCNGVELGGVVDAVVVNDGLSVQVKMKIGWSFISAEFELKRLGYPSNFVPSYHIPVL